MSPAKKLSGKSVGVSTVNRGGTSNSSEGAERPRRSSPDAAEVGVSTPAPPRTSNAPDQSSGGRRSASARPADRPWKAWIIAGGWLLGVWFALWGAITPMLAITGVLVALVALALFPLPVVEFSFGLHPIRALMLVGRFLVDVVLASFQVAWLAIRPRPPRSQVTTVQLRSTSDLIQTLTSLAVSLVPGSLIIEADPEHRTLTVHVLDPGPGGLAKFHKSVLDQEERIVRALGGDVEIDAVMGTGEPDERAVHIGPIAWGPAGLEVEADELAAAPETHQQSDLVALDADLLEDETDADLDAADRPADRPERSGTGTSDSVETVSGVKATPPSSRHTRKDRS